MTSRLFLLVLLSLIGCSTASSADCARIEIEKVSRAYTSVEATDVQTLKRFVAREFSISETAIEEGGFVDGGEYLLAALPDKEVVITIYNSMSKLEVTYKYPIDMNKLIHCYGKPSHYQAWEAIEIPDASMARIEVWYPNLAVSIFGTAKLASRPQDSNFQRFRFFKSHTIEHMRKQACVKPCLNYFSSMDALSDWPSDLQRLQVDHYPRR